jgi:hypothetical protein
MSLVWQTNNERRFPMEPQKAEPQQKTETTKAVPKSRFQIVKLEERIAPRTGRYHYPGWYTHGPPYPPGHTK